MTAGTAPQKSVRGALTRYTVMAFVTGTFLLVLTLNMILKYVVGVENETFLAFATGVAIVHGWIYVIYMATCYQVWNAMKWRIGRLATMIAGGVVPVMSFVVERKVRREVLDQLKGAA